METIRQYAKNPLAVAIAAFVVGLILGLVVLGWGLWPVQWTNAMPAQLSQEWKSDFLRMAITNYSASRDAVRAQARFEALGKDAGEILSGIVSDPKEISSQAINDFSILVGVPVAAPTTPGESPVVPPETKPATKSGPMPVLLTALCIFLLVLIGFLAYMFIYRKKALSTVTAEPLRHAPEPRQKAPVNDYVAPGSDAPTSQFMASYKLGDDLFDDSFSIDSPSGEFLGECGVGISETVGVGDHKKVTAFEVWLFDKNDIQTITKVLMSGYAFSDPSIRQRLEAKGEPVLLEPGVEAVLETQTLQLVAKVVDMSYGNGAMPEESYFEHMLLELAVWTK